MTTHAEVVAYLKKAPGFLDYDNVEVGGEWNEFESTITVYVKIDEDQ